MKSISMDHESVTLIMKRMKDDNIMHRNCGWMPLREPNETPEWVKDVLIPFLNQETGITWSIAGNRLLHSETTTMFLPISSMWDKLNGILGENKALCKIKKKYPTLREDDFGYKIKNEFIQKLDPDSTSLTKDFGLFQ